MWTMEEDLRLLDGIETYGLGNWVDVADAVGNNKSAKKCLERYCDDFLGRYGHILPEYTLVEDHNDNSIEEEPQESSEEIVKEDESVASSNSNSIPSTTPKRKKKNKRNSMWDLFPGPKPKPKKYSWVLTSTLPEYPPHHPYVPPLENIQQGTPVKRDQTARAELAYAKALSATTTLEEAKTLVEQWKANSTINNDPAFLAQVFHPRLEDIRTLKGSELAGYMPRRGDFDCEWNNDAEAIVADMEFSAKDTPNERQLKLDILDIYNQKLDERERRKKFLQDWNLLDYRKNQLMLRALPKDEMALRQRMRLFARFFDGPTEFDAFLDDLIKAKKLRNEIAAVQFNLRMGMTTVADMEEYKLDTQRRKHHKLEFDKKTEQDHQQKIDMERYKKESSTVFMSAVANSANKSDRKNRKSIHRNSLGVPDNHQPEDNSMESNEPPLTAATDKFNIASLHGYNLLHSKEIQLCQNLQLKPNTYLEAKKALIKQCLERGMLDRGCILEDADAPTAGGINNRQTLFKIDVEKRGLIFDFVVRSGWVSATPSSTKKKDPPPKSE